MNCTKSPAGKTTSLKQREHVVSAKAFQVLGGSRVSSPNHKKRKVVPKKAFQVLMGNVSAQQTKKGQEESSKKAFSITRHLKDKVQSLFAKKDDQLKRVESESKILKQSKVGQTQLTIIVNNLLFVDERPIEQ